MILDYRRFEETIERARRNNLMEFEINEGGWQPNDLSALMPYKDEIAGLFIRKKMKLKHLMSFSNLKWLTVNGFSEPIDLSYLTNLENLLLCENKKVINLNALKKLKVLELRGNYGDDLTNIQEIESLEKVQLLWSKVKSLKGIGHLKNLRSIEVESRDLMDMSDLEEVFNLVSIDISDCKNLKITTDFSKLQNLEYLYLFRAGSIENVNFLNKLSNLKEFRFYQTNVENGNLMPCLNVKELVAFDKKSHYSHTEKAMMNLINEKKIGKKVINQPIETYKLPYFGDISINPLEDCELVEDISGVSIGLSLHFEQPIITVEQLEKTKQLLERIEAIYTIARNHIDADFGKKGKVDEYIKELIDCMDKDELASITKDADKKLKKKEQIFSCIHISVIHIYPHDNCRMCLYFTIEEGWDDILTMQMDADGVVISMAIES